jgi:hypothetical protein
MKLKISLLCYLLITLCSKPFCQDKDVIAKNYYLKAEDAFNNEQFLYSYYLLQKTTKALGTDNSKILDLKIRSAYSAINIDDDYKYFNELKKDIDQFFKITDAKKYPEDKYFAIVEIKEKVNSIKVNFPSVSDILRQSFLRMVNNDTTFYNQIKSLEIDYTEYDTRENSVNSPEEKIKAIKKYVLKKKAEREDSRDKKDDKTWISKHFLKDTSVYHKFEDLPVKKLEASEAARYLYNFKNVLSAVPHMLTPMFLSSYEGLRVKSFSTSRIELRRDPDFSAQGGFYRPTYIFDGETYDFIGADVDVWEDGKITPWSQTKCLSFKLMGNKIWMPTLTEFNFFYSGKSKTLNDIHSVTFNKDYPEDFWY